MPEKSPLLPTRFVRPTRLVLVFLIVAFGHTRATAQEKIPEFGKIDPSELTMKECSFEKSAGAMILLKTASIRFEISGWTSEPVITTEYRARIKIFSRRGFQAANVKIPYFSKSRSSRIKDVEAFIYSLDAKGKIAREKIEKKEIFNERGKSDARRSLNYLAFTYPDLKEGSVIEYRYSKIDKNSMGIAPWFFQDEIPTAYSSVTAAMPAYMSMTYHVLTNDSIERTSSSKIYYKAIYNEDIRTFTALNIHSFRIEPLMTSLKDNLERVEFSLSPARYRIRFLKSEDHWRMYNYMLLSTRSFGGQFDRPLDGAGPFIDSVKGLHRTEDKISAVYRYIRKNIEWNGESTFLCDSLEACWKNKSGSNAEINILFLNLLRKTGVICYPILVSSSANGNPDTEFPSLSQFNGVDVLVFDSLNRYPVDCTQKQLSFKIPPFNILNSNAYMVDPSNYGWIFMADPRILMKNVASIDASMDTSGLVRGTSKISLIGFAKTETLAELRHKKDKDQPEKPGISDNAPDLVIDSALMENSAEDNDTLVQRLTFHFSPSNTDKFYFLNPFLFASFKKNPFTDSVRFSEIDFGCNQSMDARISIRLPKNISVESLPKDISIWKDDSTILFERKISADNGYLLINNSFILRHAVFIREEYPSIKSFFDKFYGLLNEEIILKKRS
jgi:hypothetical protein